jgi:hypothetical protein
MGETSSQENGALKERYERFFCDSPSAAFASLGETIKN